MSISRSKLAIRWGEFKRKLGFYTHIWTKEQTAEYDNYRKEQDEAEKAKILNSIQNKYYPNSKKLGALLGNLKLINTGLTGYMFMAGFIVLCGLTSWFWLIGIPLIIANVIANNIQAHSCREHFKYAPKKPGEAQQEPKSRWVKIGDVLLTAACWAFALFGCVQYLFNGFLGAGVFLSAVFGVSVTSPFLLIPLVIFMGALAFGNSVSFYTFKAKGIANNLKKLKDALFDKEHIVRSIFMTLLALPIFVFSIFVTFLYQGVKAFHALSRGQFFASVTSFPQDSMAMTVGITAALCTTFVNIGSVFSEFCKFVTKIGEKAEAYRKDFSGLSPARKFFVATVAAGDLITFSGIATFTSVQSAFPAVLGMFSLGLAAPWITAVAVVASLVAMTGSIVYNWRKIVRKEKKDCDANRESGNKKKSSIEKIWQYFDKYEGVKLLALGFLSCYAVATTISNIFPAVFAALPLLANPLTLAAGLLVLLGIVVAARKILSPAEVVSKNLSGSEHQLAVPAPTKVEQPAPKENCLRRCFGCLFRKPSNEKDYGITEDDINSVFNQYGE